MNNLNQKSIVLARVPFSNITDYKIRPAIIISNNHYNKNHPDFWIVPLSSQEKNKEFELELDKKEIIKGNLDQKSFVRADVIATIEQELVLKEIGKVSDDFFKKIISRVQENLKP